MAQNDLLPLAAARLEHDTLADAILEAALDCVVFMNTTGRVLEWNRAAEETFGWTREEVLGKDLADLLVPPDLREAHRRGLAHYMATGEARVMGRRLELTALTADGSELPVELTITRTAGEPPVFVGYMRDITERKRRERALMVAAERRDALLALGTRALEGESLESLLEGATELAVRELGLDYCEFWETLPSGEFLLQAGCGWPESALQKLRLPGHEGLEPGFTLAAPGPVLVDDFGEDRRFSPAGFLVEQGIVSGISVTIPGPGRPYGTIGGHSERKGAFDEADAGFLESLAHVLGAAIARRKVERRIEGAEQRYRTLVERLPVVTYVAEYGEEGRWTFVSPQIEELLGYTPAEWMADPRLWLEHIHPDDREAVLAREEECNAEDRPFSMEYRMLARSGQMVWVRDEASRATTHDGEDRIEGLLSDITEERRVAEELRYRADHDELTGLLNRRRFEEEIDRHLAGGGAVLIVDLDHLKLVNDSLGHATGDGVLQSTATALRATVRQQDTLARIGGDEFAVLLPGATADGARALASRLLEAIRSRDGRYGTTGSAGVAVFEPHGTATADDLLVAADIALYEAKEAGRDRVVLFSGREGERLAWVGRVREAIEEGGLVLHGQPIVDLRTGETVGHELLVRMLGRDGEIVPPSRFLPTAERFGLVGRIDRWVVTRALELVEQGRQVSVNLSALSLGDQSLTTLIGERLAESGADPAHLVLEITETAIAADMADVRAFAERVELLGCGLALDDFGTGFGSLSYIKNLHARYLKIDMDFVRELPTSVTDRRIVRAIVGMAQGLGMRTVAEGVEDARTLEVLKLYGVDYAQGYHLGRPAPLEQ